MELSFSGVFCSPMHRRRFLALSALASASLLTRDLLADGPPRTAPIASDFTGLSYESRQLGDPNFFAASNKQLVALVSLLGTHGVLRIGGNTSEYCFFDPSAKAPAPSISADPDKGHVAPPHTTIIPEAIRNLRRFLDATNWSLVYGLNFGKGTPKSAAEEAAFVSDIIGPRLLAFQIGNEPDLFPHNGLRPEDWSLPQFLEEWQQFYEAIHARVPSARFLGPANSNRMDWTTAFVDRFHDRLAGITEHYYAEGPPTDPTMTLDRLLLRNPKFERTLSDLDALRDRVHLPYRIAETNSCYSGGKPGVSNTFASALWAADLMFSLAAHRSAGINLHGGGNGWYTPIAGSPESGFTARPIYYGMLLFREATRQDAAIEPSGLFDNPLIGGYKLHSRSSESLVIINKQSDTPVSYDVFRNYADMHIKRAKVLALTAPALDATSGITFGGTSVITGEGNSAAWIPAPQRLEAHDGELHIDVPPASAALITLSR